MRRKSRRSRKLPRIRDSLVEFFISRPISRKANQCRINWRLQLASPRRNVTTSCAVAAPWPVLIFIRISPAGYAAAQGRRYIWVNHNPAAKTGYRSTALSLRVRSESVREGERSKVNGRRNGPGSPSRRSIGSIAESQRHKLPFLSSRPSNERKPLARDPSRTSSGLGWGA